MWYSVSERKQYSLKLILFHFSDPKKPYQLCSGAFPEINKEIMLEADASKYFFINQGMLKIDKDKIKSVYLFIWTDENGIKIK